MHLKNQLQDFKKKLEIQLVNLVNRALRKKKENVHLIIIYLMKEIRIIDLKEHLKKTSQNHLVDLVQIAKKKIVNILIQNKTIVII
jgi:hypothetical protein